MSGGSPLLHIVFVAPEIPPNTGTTARLCAATETRFHLVGPLGFSLEDRYLRRAGLDYWPHVDVCPHESFADYERAHPEASMHLFTSRGGRSHTDVRFQPGDHLIFGGETSGLADAILERFPERRVTIPMSGKGVRSLNLANAAAIGLYEALRQLGRT
ncbi:MAG: tRNA (cytidine(34)-2'-O)-methyltransferase [Candidatus Binatia bacterium]